jgi:ATP-binding cassette subfamily B protein
VSPHAPSDLTLYRRLGREVRPYGVQLLGLVLLGLLASPIALLTPLPLKIAVDNVLGQQPLPPALAVVLPDAAAASGHGLLLWTAVLLVLIGLLGQLRELAFGVLKTWIGERLVLDFRSRLFDRAQRLSFTHHDATGTADAMYRIRYDAEAINYLTVEGAVPFLSAAATVAGMLYVSLRIDLSLALVALSVVPVLLVLSGSVRRRLRAQARQLKRLDAGVLAVIQETLGALRVVRAFGQEDRQNRQFAREAGASVRAKLRLALVEGGAGVLVGLTTALGMALVVYLGVSHVRSGVLSLGALLLIAGYLGQLYAPLRTLSRKVSSMQSHLASAERAFALLDQPGDVPERADARSLERARGEVVFQRVSFGYDPSQPVLHDVSLAIEPGTRVTITGTTGAGKTTLVSLLTRFYDPTAGAILLDGVDLRAYRLADLRDQFAIVLQQPVLFSTTIAENIAYGRPGAGAREIEAAARAANAHDFIVALPHGYETQVGERGMRLSGGERQRVALARAVLKDAPILILDEPTSSVDVGTEAAILEALERVMRGRTVFLITHRPSALPGWDRRLQFQHGRLAEAAPAMGGVG